MSFVADVSSGVLDPLPELHLDGYRLRIHVTCASEMDRMTELLDGGTAKGEVDLDSQSEAFLDVPPIATTWMFNRIRSISRPREVQERSTLFDLLSVLV